LAGAAFLVAADFAEADFVAEAFAPADFVGVTFAMRVLSCPPRGPELYAEPSRGSTSATGPAIDAVARRSEDAVEQGVDPVELEALDAEALAATGVAPDQAHLSALHTELVGEERDQGLVGPSTLRRGRDLDLQRVAEPPDDRGTAGSRLRVHSQDDRVVTGELVETRGHCGAL
jgi:hypothetical protein